MGAASSPWHSLSRDAAHPPAAPCPHTHLGDMTSAADIPGLVAGCTQTWAHFATHTFTHTRASPACTCTCTPCRHRHTHTDMPSPFACTCAFSSPHGPACCTQVHTLHAHAYACILHAHTLLHAHPTNTSLLRACRCILHVHCKYLTPPRTRCPDSRLTQTYTRACTHGVSSAVRGQLSCPLVQVGGTPCPWAGPTAAQLASQRWEQQLTALCWTPGSGSALIWMGAPMGCPNASHSSRVLRGVPAEP